ncbi:MAG: rod shape-determining protein MreD [Gammaproteobacteria bacterium]|nr:rod shape-determining protein MreD [Gammaproteobacteria bacterium]
MMPSRWRLSLVAAIMLLLSIMPFGAVLSLFRPFWVLLFVLYLQYTLPKQCNVLFILFFGLLLDALSAGVIGQHAFALLLTAWVSLKRSQRFRLLWMSQQLFGIAVLALLYQLALLSIQFILGYPVSVLGVLLPIVMTALCWPWMQYLGDRIFFTTVRQANRNDVI